MSSESQRNSNLNAATSIIQRIKDVKGLCDSGKLGKFAKEIQLNAEKIIIDTNGAANDNQQTMMTGVVVNGFHPQLSAWQKNQSNIQHCNTKNNKLDGEIHHVVESCRAEECGISTEASMGKPRFARDADVRDIYRDVFETSEIAQVITSPGT